MRLNQRAWKSVDKNQLKIVPLYGIFLAFVTHFYRTMDKAKREEIAKLKHKKRCESMGIDPKIMVSKAEEHGLEPQGENGWMTYPIPEDVSLNTRMHLNREQVAELLPYLERFVETGYLHE